MFEHNLLVTGCLYRLIDLDWRASPRIWLPESVFGRVGHIPHVGCCVSGITERLTFGTRLSGVMPACSFTRSGVGNLCCVLVVVVDFTV